MLAKFGNSIYSFFSEESCIAYTLKVHLYMLSMPKKNMRNRKTPVSYQCQWWRDQTEVCRPCRAVRNAVFVLSKVDDPSPPVTDPSSAIGTDWFLLDFLYLRVERLPTVTSSVDRSCVGTAHFYVLIVTLCAGVVSFYASFVPPFFLRRYNGNSTCL